MKTQFRISRLALGALLMAVSVFQSIAAQERSADASFLVERSGDRFSLDVLVENPEVTVFDLMFPVGSLTKAESMLEQCTSGVQASHVGGCNIAEGEFRMVVFSPTNATLQTGRIGSFNLPGVQVDPSSIRIRAYNDKGEELDVEVLGEGLTSGKTPKERIAPPSKIE